MPMAAPWRAMLARLTLWSSRLATRRTQRRTVSRLLATRPSAVALSAFNPRSTARPVPETQTVRPSDSPRGRRTSCLSVASVSINAPAGGRACFPPAVQSGTQSRDTARGTFDTRRAVATKSSLGVANRGRRQRTPTKRASGLGGAVDCLACSPTSGAEEKDR
jgi:hypothetical protein